MKGNIHMRKLFLILLLASSFALAQDTTSSTSSAKNDASATNSKGEVTLQGCLDRSRGDYVLMQTNPAVTYQLQGKGKTKLRNYVGQRVEVTGTKSTSMSTSSDAIAFGGSPAPITISVSSIKTLDAQCSSTPVTR